MCHPKLMVPKSEPHPLDLSHVRRGRLRGGTRLLLRTAKRRGRRRSARRTHRESARHHWLRHFRPPLPSRRDPPPPAPRQALALPPRHLAGASPLSCDRNARHGRLAGAGHRVYRDLPCHHRPVCHCECVRAACHGVVAPHGVQEVWRK